MTFLAITNDGFFLIFLPFYMQLSTDNQCNRATLRPAGGDPEVNRPKKYFFDGLCFFE